MKATLIKLKTDLYRVFVKGDADTTQLARVFVLLALPVTTVVAIFGQLLIY